MAATIQTIEKPTRARALDTSGNNNHGQIYSGRALEFDGVTDYLTFTHTGMLENFTVSAWVNINSFSAINQLHSGGAAGLYPSIKASTGEVQWYNGSAWLEGSTLELNTWYRLVYTFSKNGSAGDYHIYINGVNTLSSIGTGTYTDGYFDEFGAINGASRIFNGMASDIQIWNTVWTADDALYDYNNPEQLALNRGGTSLTNSNLKLWYPMNDGHRGQQSYILDASNTGIGNELIDSQSDRDFSGSNNWALVNGSGSATMSTTGGQLVFSGSTTSDYPYLHRDYVTDFKAGDSIRYELVLSDVSGGTVKVQLDGGANIATGLTSGTNIFYHNGTSGNALKGETRIIPESSSMSFKIDSLSLKPVNDKNHATTVFTGDDLWDGADNSVSNWTAGSGTSTHVAAADCIKLTPATSSNGSYIQLRNTKDLTADLVVGRKYQLSYDSAGDIVGSESKMSVYDGSSFQAASSTTTVTNVVGNGNMDSSGTWTEVPGSGNINRTSSTKHNGTHSYYVQTVSGNRANIVQTITGLTAKSKYLLTYWSQNANASAGGDIEHRVYDNDNGADLIAYAASGNETTSWSQTAVQFTTGSGNTSINLQFQSPTGNYLVYVDDVVISAFETNTIDFTAGHATNCELRHQDANGADVVTNGTFASDSGWTKGTGFTIGSGTADCDGSQSGNTSLAQTYAGGFEAGRKYSISFTISDYTAGSINPHITGASSGNVNGNGTKTSVITATSSNNDIVMYANADFDAKIDDIVIYPLENLWVDDISLKEVGTATGWTDADQQLDIPQTALQSYNQLAWFDGYASDTAATLDSQILWEVGQTINMWVYPNVLNQYDSIFGDRNTRDYIRTGRASGTYSTNDEIFQFEMHDNLTSVDDNDMRIKADGAGTLEVGKWLMWTFIWNADRTVDWYENGQKKGDSPATADTTDGKKMEVKYFGAGYGTSSQPFEGAMTEISHYTDVLTQAEINDLYNDGKAKSALEASGSGGLSLYLRNNGLSEWKDLKGSNDANVDSAETMLITAGADASRDSQGFLMNRQRLTNSLNLSYCLHVDSYTDLGSIRTIPAGDAFSLTLWINPSQVVNNKFIGASDTDYIRIKETSIIRFYANSTSHDLSLNSGSWVANEWVHISIVRNTSNLATLYINGSAQTDTETINKDFLYRYIGSVGPASYTFDGAIDDVCIYEDELTAAEVKRNYNAGKRSHR